MGKIVHRILDGEDTGHTKKLSTSARRIKHIGTSYMGRVNSCENIPSTGPVAVGTLGPPAIWPGSVAHRQQEDPDPPESGSI